MMKNNNWIKSLKDKVEDGSTLPKPTVSWEKLEGEMDRIARRRKVWKVVGGVCATAAAVLCAFMLIDIPQETNRIHIIENGEVVTTAESIRHSERQRRISTDEPRHSER
ncbi:MAG: hypothetical protein HUJ92_06565, partial [Bacteroidales bacterium]|nr:hypothetical protein [Bacteroidales bacterium]